MEYNWHQVKWHSTCIDSVSARAGRTGGRCLQINCVRESSLIAYITRHPIETQLTPCDGIDWHQVQWQLLMYCSVSARAAQLEDGWSPNKLCRESSLMTYIIKQPIETQFDPCDGIHSHQVSDLLRVLISVQCQRRTTGGRMGLQMIVWGRAVSCLHNQAPNLHHWLLVNGIQSHQVSDITTCIDSVSARAGDWGTDGLQMHCVRESSLMFT